VSADTWETYRCPQFFPREIAPRSAFRHRLFGPFVLVVDLDEDGTMSVTNDADRVVAFCLRNYGKERILYRDSMQQWDELAHDGTKFVGFRALPRCFKIDREAGV